MVEPKQPDPEKEPFYKKFIHNKRLNQEVRSVWKKRIEIVSGALMLAGIIISFFYIHIGAFFAGFAFGLCFFEEIYNSFVQLRDFYTEQGIFKTLMWIATILFFLISIPVFIVAAAIGFALIFLIRRFFKK